MPVLLRPHVEVADTGYRLGLRRRGGARRRTRSHRKGGGVREGRDMAMNCQRTITQQYNHNKSKSQQPRGSPPPVNKSPPPPSLSLSLTHQDLRLSGAQEDVTVHRACRRRRRRRTRAPLDGGGGGRHLFPEQQGAHVEPLQEFLAARVASLGGRAPWLQKKNEQQQARGGGARKAKVLLFCFWASEKKGAVGVRMYHWTRKDTTSYVVCTLGGNVTDAQIGIEVCWLHDSRTSLSIGRLCRRCTNRNRSLLAVIAAHMKRIPEPRTGTSALASAFELT